jgi:YHS domain-containing protein
VAGQDPSGVATRNRSGRGLQRNFPWLSGLFVVEVKRAMERDPICGAAVDPNATRPELVLSVRNRTYYFCSIRCRLEFEEDALPALPATLAGASKPRTLRKNGESRKTRKKVSRTCASAR